MQLPPLLITSAVRPADTGVVLVDAQLRIQYTLDAIEHWLAMSPQIRIVLCDGSGFDFTPLLDQRFPGHKIEALHFQNSVDMVRHYGKGFGEGEIVSYALIHSNYLSTAGFFAKCTSKLWVTNFNECLRHWNGRLLFQAKISNILKNKPLRFRHIDTRFYIVNRSMYDQLFATAHQRVNDSADHSLEHCFREAIQRSGLERFLFPVPPLIVGYSGTTGTLFTNSLWDSVSERIKLMVLAMRTDMVSHNA
jgi:hypothetical protein